MHIPPTILMTEWLRIEQEKLLTRKKRLYLHFDKRIAKINHSLGMDVWNKEKMASHHFFPLIRTTLKERKFDVEKHKLKKEKTFKEKSRMITYAGHFDSLVYSRYSFELNQRYNDYSVKKAFDKNIIAYRTNRPHQNTVHYVKEVLDFINSKESCVVFCFDIKGFFDSLDHAKMKKSWSMLSDDGKTIRSDEYAVFKSVTKFHYVDRDEAYKEFDIDSKKTRNYEQICKIQELVKHRHLIQENRNTFGIPQGTPISATLSNIYMIAFDLAVSAWVAQHDGFYRRYSDDILVICNPSDRDELQDLVTYAIQERKLEIQNEKTEEVYFTRLENNSMSCEKNNGHKSRLVYLGISFDGQNVDLRQRSLQKYFQRRSEKIKSEIFKARKYSRVVDKKKILNKFSHKSQKSFVSYMRTSSKILNSDVVTQRVSQKNTTEQAVLELKKRLKKKPL